MQIGAVFGRFLLSGAVITAIFALAGAAGMLPKSVGEGHGTERQERGHHGSGDVGMPEIAEVLRREGFSEPYSMEREHGMIEAKAIGPDGRRYEVYIDPKTGRILKREEDD